MERPFKCESIKLKNTNKMNVYAEQREAIPNI